MYLKQVIETRDQDIERVQTLMAQQGPTLLALSKTVEALESLPARGTTAKQSEPNAIHQYGSQALASLLGVVVTAVVSGAVIISGDELESLGNGWDPRGWNVWSIVLIGQMLVALLGLLFILLGVKVTNEERSDRLVSWGFLLNKIAIAIGVIIPIVYFITRPR